jgi:hypothetical protein
LASRFRLNLSIFRYPEVTNDGAFDRVRNEVIDEYNKVAEEIVKTFNPGTLFLETYFIRNIILQISYIFLDFLFI